MQQCIAEVTAQYGQATIDRINFDRGRIKPAFQVNASVGANLYKRDRFNVQIQADGMNLTDVLNVIDFGRLHLHAPEVRYDLPAAGRRIVQRADGYQATVVSGVITYADGVPTGRLPGRLIRGAKPHPGIAG